MLEGRIHSVELILNVWLDHELNLVSYRDISDHLTKLNNMNKVIGKKPLTKQQLLDKQAHEKFMQDYQQRQAMKSKSDSTFAAQNTNWNVRDYF